MMDPKKQLLVDGGTNGCSEQELEGLLSVEAVLISKHFGYVENYSLNDPSYKMDLSTGGLQFYRGKQEKPCCLESQPD